MNKKIFFQGLIIIAFFFGTWKMLSLVDFIKLFAIEDIRVNAEEKIGKLIWSEIELNEKVISNDTLENGLGLLIRPICEKNKIPFDSIHLHVVCNEEINAFALPNNHIVINTGLINACKKSEAFQGVIAHEIAHLQQKHVMKKLTKEFGLSVLLSLATNGKGSALIQQILKTVSSTGYDRNLEHEADKFGVDYLITTQIDPKPLSEFMYQLAKEEHSLSKSMYWISTHPDSEARAKFIIQYASQKRYTIKTYLTEKEWKAFQKSTEYLATASSF